MSEGRTWMPKLPKLPKLPNVVEAIGVQNKAVAAGMLAATPAMDTLLLAFLAWWGLGVMPPEADLVEAIRQLYWATLTWAGVYLIPNLTKGNSGQILNG